MTAANDREAAGEMDEVSVAAMRDWLADALREHAESSDYVSSLTVDRVANDLAAFANRLVGAQARGDGWVDCAQVRPGSFERVLTVSASGRYRDAWWDDYRGEWMKAPNNQPLGYEPTHWRPLPPPPRALAAVSP